MIEKTFTYNDATITCKRATVRSRLQSDFVYSHFVTKETEPFDMYTYTTFARFLTQCTVTGSFDFDIPGVGADTKAMQAGLDAFLELPGAFMDALVEALNEVDVALPKKT